MKFLLVFSLLGPMVARALEYDANHAVWGQWLKQYTTVTGPVTTVNYKEAKANAAPLDSYTAMVESFPKLKYDALPEKERLAFLINGYNALTVKWILKNYPVSSIKDTGSLFSSAWKKKFFTLFGEEQNLDGIEHGIIRKQFAEPRIHFAVVCASKGCPALKGEPYVAAKLEEQLEASARGFLSDSTRNYYNQEENRFYLSKIFDWYGDDFIKAAGSVQAFVGPKIPAPIRDVAALSSASVKYLNYDWALNGQ